MEADEMANMKLLGEIYRKYVETCYKSGAMDFDDLLLRTNELLTRFPEVLAKYQDRFRYILVDEYRDTNHSQYLIVKALASTRKFVCGRRRCTVNLCISWGEYLQHSEL